MIPANEIEPAPPAPSGHEEANPRALRVLYVTSQLSEDGKKGAPFVRREIEALCAGGSDVDVFIYEGGWSLPAYVRAIRALRARLRHKAYDVVHARFGQCGLVGRAQWKVPVVITYGGSDVQGSLVFAGLERYKNYALCMVSWLLSLFVDEVIVVSDHLGKKLPRRAYHVIPSGIDFSLFRPIDKEVARAQLGMDQNKRFVLFAADPKNKQKRYDLARQACERAAQSIDNELVVLTGKPSDQVPVYMNACDVLLLTSANEGSPNVVKEALACNVPVVAVDVGDVRERIGSVEGCVLCERDTPEALAEALVSVLRRGQRVAARETVKDLGVAVMASKVLAVYHKALASK